MGRASLLRVRVSRLGPVASDLNRLRFARILLERERAIPFDRVRVAAARLREHLHAAGLDAALLLDGRDGAALRIPLADAPHVFALFTTDPNAVASDPHRPGFHRRNRSRNGVRGARRHRVHRRRSHHAALDRRDADRRARDPHPRLRRRRDRRSRLGALSRSREAHRDRRGARRVRGMERTGRRRRATRRRQHASLPKGRRRSRLARRCPIGDRRARAAVGECDRNSDAVRREQRDPRGYHRA